MCFREPDRGAAIIVAAIALPVMIAGLGLVVDNGQAYDLKRRLQQAADAAAIAGAQEIKRDQAANVEKEVLRNAARNGFAKPGAEIGIFSPPATGRRAGQRGFVEVKIRHEAPFRFLRVLSDERFTVEARAVAGVVSRRNCAVALNRSAPSAVRLGVGASIELHDCGLHVNSDAPYALRALGASALTSAGADVVGGYKGQGFVPPPLKGVEAIEDPLASVLAPGIAGCLRSQRVRVERHDSFSPGVYCGGIEVAPEGTAVLAPGVYVLKGGGLAVEGTLHGESVMFYNTTGSYGYRPIVFAAGSIAKLSAPRTGAHAGILFFQDRAVSRGATNELVGSARSRFEGALYFATTALSFTGATGMDQQPVVIVADTIELNGPLRLTAPAGSERIAPPTRQAALVY